jgi:hypothetical protein
MSNRICQVDVVASSMANAVGRWWLWDDTGGWWMSEVSAGQPVGGVVVEGRYAVRGLILRALGAC